MVFPEIINNRLFETVHPCLVSKNYIGNVNGVLNAVIIEGKPVGESILQGEGAGPGLPLHLYYQIYYQFYEEI